MSEKNPYHDDRGNKDGSIAWQSDLAVVVTTGAKVTPLKTASIKPAVDAVRAEHPDKDICSDEYIDLAVEENVRQGGFGSAVLEAFNDAGINGYQLERIGIADTFVEHGPQALLRSKYGIDAEAIVQSAKRLMNASGRSMDKWPSSQAV